MDVDAVAKAICNADHQDWDTLLVSWGPHGYKCDDYRRMAEAALAAMEWREIPEDVDYYDSPEEAVDDALARTFQGSWDQQNDCKGYILERIRRYGFKIVRDMAMDINKPPSPPND